MEGAWKNLQMVSFHILAECQKLIQIFQKEWEMVENLLGLSTK